jgi:hypothetical protein
MVSAPRLPGATEDSGRPADGSPFIQRRRGFARHDLFRIALGAALHCARLLQSILRSVRNGVNARHAILLTGGFIAYIANAI